MKNLIVVLLHGKDSGYLLQDNADHNASVNIKNRYSLEVLRKSKQIHSFDEYGRMISCSKNKYLIKDILLSVFNT